MILLNFDHMLFADSEVTGIQFGIWLQQRSPYIVKSDIVIPEGLVLQIESGVVVKFTGNYQISVKGALIANADKAKPIVFTSIFDSKFGEAIINHNSTPRSADWKGIEFFDSCDAYVTVLNHCIIRYSNWAIRCSKSFPILSNIKITETDNHILKLNDQDYPFEPGQIISPLPQENRPLIKPLPEPVEETDLAKMKRLWEQRKQKLEQERLRALQDSVRKANKLKPILTKTGRLYIERRLFDHFDIQNIKDLISFMPGFLNLATIWTGSQLSSRGIPLSLANNRVLYQVEGIPFYEPVAKTSYLEFIPLDAIDQIVIDRGIMLSPFNHHGIIGTVNFIPRYENSTFFNKTRIELGEFGTKKLSTFLALNRDSTFVNLSTNFMNSSGYWETFPQKTEGLNFRQKYASDRYNFCMFLKHTSFNLFTSYFENDQFQLGLIPQFQTASPINRNGFVFSLSKAVKINPRVTSRIIGNYVRVIERSEVDLLDTSKVNQLTIGDHFLSKGNLLSIAILTQYKQPHYQATAGIAISRYFVEPLFRFTDDNGKFIDNDSMVTVSSMLDYENAGFVEFGYNFSPFIGFVGKTEVNFTNSSIRPDISFDAKIIYNPFLPVDSYLKYSVAARSAALIEKRIYLPDFFMGNLDLKSERFEQWEWCTDFHLTPDLSCGLTLYYLKNKNLIQLNPDYHFINSSKALMTTGYEFMFQGKMTKNIFFLSNIAHHQAKSSVWFYPRWKMNGLFRIHWFREFSTITTFQYISQFDKEQNLGSYYLLGMSLAYQLFPKMKIAVNSVDLLDQCPKNPEYIRNEMPAIPAGPGRSFYFSISIE